MITWTSISNSFEAATHPASAIFQKSAIWFVTKATDLRSPDFSSVPTSVVLPGVVLSLFYAESVVLDSGVGGCSTWHPAKTSPSNKIQLLRNLITVPFSILA
jgi:hypothetical protein